MTTISAVNSSARKSHLVPVREFTSAADLIAHQRAVHARLGVPRRLQHIDFIRPVDTDWSAPEAEQDNGPDPEPEPKPRLRPKGPLVRDIWFLSSLDKDPSFRGYNPAAVILDQVASKYCVSAEDIRGPRRMKHLVTARHEAIARIAQELPSWSLPRIGRFMGDRDHTTILHALKKTGLR